MGIFMLFALIELEQRISYANRYGIGIVFAAT